MIWTDHEIPSTHPTHPTIPTAFIQGLGYYLTESVQFDTEGRLLTTGTWVYKPPSALDIPLEFNVTLIPKDLSPGTILQSKATGERT